MRRKLSSALLVLSWIFFTGCGGHNLSVGLLGATTNKDGSSSTGGTSGNFHCSGVASPLSANIPVHADFSASAGALSLATTVTFTCNADATVVSLPTGTGGAVFGNPTVAGNAVATTGTFAAHGMQKVTMQFAERARPANVVTAVALVDVVPVPDGFSCTASVAGNSVRITSDSHGSTVGKTSDQFTLSVSTPGGRQGRITSIAVDPTSGGTLTVGSFSTSTVSSTFSITNNKLAGFAGVTGIIVTMQDTSATPITTKCRAPIAFYTDTNTNVDCSTVISTTQSVTTIVGPGGSGDQPISGAQVDLTVTSNKAAAITAVTGPPGLKVISMTGLSAKLDLGPNDGAIPVVAKITFGADSAYCPFVYNATDQNETPVVVHRFYSVTHKDHFLTTDNAGPDSSWGPEATAFSVFPAKSAACNVEVTACHLTVAPTQHFISPDAGCEGETVEKTLGYGCPFQASGTSPVLRGESNDGGDHLTTINSTDLLTFLNHTSSTSAQAKDQTVPYYVPGSYTLLQRIGP